MRHDLVGNDDKVDKAADRCDGSGGCKNVGECAERVDGGRGVSIELAGRTSLAETRGEVFGSKMREEAKLISADKFEINSTDSDGFVANFLSELQQPLSQSFVSGAIQQISTAHHLPGPAVSDALLTFLSDLLWLCTLTDVHHHFPIF